MSHTLDLIERIIRLLNDLSPLILLLIPYGMRKAHFDNQQVGAITRAAEVARVVVAAADAEVRSLKRDGAWNEESAAALRHRVLTDLGAMAERDLKLAAEGATSGMTPREIARKLLESEVTRIKATRGEDGTPSPDVPGIMQKLLDTLSTPSPVSVSERPPASPSDPPRPTMPMGPPGERSPNDGDPQKTDDADKKMSDPSGGSN